MYEAHNIFDDEKNSAYLLFKRIMKILRYSTLVSVYNKEEENAKFIKDAYSEWNTMREDIKSHNSQLLKLWEKETDIKEDLNYLG
jgi:predicted nucleotide-binding protein (sugar kinase/HSP70/actin superfamily)